jgi:hypothetical protein
LEVRAAFDSTKRSLLELLQDVRRGKVQLPDFQRGWIWDDEHVRSLLASVSLSYPIGAVMLLETGNPSVRFKPLLLEGVKLDNPPEPEDLILDGQQRLTSLFQSLLLEQPVLTRDARKKPIRRWYYLKMAEALDQDADREENIIGVPEDRILKNFRGEPLVDYSAPEKEYEHGVFPFSQMFDSSDWRTGYQEYWDYDKEKNKLFNAFEKQVIKRFEQYQVPLIVLGKETPKEAVCQVFEKVNTGGVPLTVFELLTATYAAEDFNLKEDWAARKKRLKQRNVLHTISSTDFLQAVTLLATYARKQQDPDRAISCKRKDILRLTLDDYQTWAEPATVGLEKAARFLYSQKIFAARDLPYRTQVILLAAILSALGEEADSDGVRTKVAKWFWCGVFGELYGSAVESRFAKDLPEVLHWIASGPEPDTVSEANFAPSRLFTLRSRNSAAYKGLHASLLRDGALDFATGEPIDVQMYFADSIDIHHIFPQRWCQDNGIARERYDSIVNKTPLSARTNRKIGRRAPSVYLPLLQAEFGISEERMDEILHSHVVEPPCLRTDNFDAFLAARQQALLERVEKVMGKPVIQAPVESEESDLRDYEEEDAA